MRLTEALRERKGFLTQDGNSSPLGRLAASGKISREEFLAGVAWRNHYLRYLYSIAAPEPFGSSDNEIHMSDDQCKDLADEHKRGCKILNALGKRVFHAVTALVVYEESEALGDFEFTAAAAQRGLAALARGH